SSELTCVFFFFSSRRRHTRFSRDWSSDVCSSDLKGVCITHGNLTWKNLGHIVEFGLTADDTTLVCGPLYHVGGFDLPGVGTLHAGGSLTVMRKFEAAKAVDIIERERPTNVWLAPSLMNAILQLPDREIG